MTTLETILAFSLTFIYFAALFTVAVLTFRKGRIVLGIVGFLLPLLWFVGAVLPAKEGSRYDVAQREKYEEEFRRSESL